MRAYRTTALALALSIAGLPFAVCGGAEATPEKAIARAKWEYRALTKKQIIDLGKNDLAAGLSKLGEEGWELVAVEGGSEREGARAVFYFKRPAAADRPQIKTFSLRNANAVEVATLLQRIFRADRNIKIMAVGAQNLLVLGPPDALREIASLLPRLDVPGGNE